MSSQIFRFFYAVMDAIIQLVNFVYQIIGLTTLPGKLLKIAKCNACLDKPFSLLFNITELIEKPDNRSGL